MTFVPSIGPLTAKIAFVGAAPNNIEASKGQPFLGATGEMFDDLLRQAGLTRSTVYLTNVIKTQQPANRTDSLIKFGRSGATETPAYREHLAMLAEELNMCQANIIAAMGNVPLYALTGKTGATLRRGSVYECTLIPGRKVIAMNDLYSTNRNYILRYNIAHDMRRVVEESEFPEVREVPRTYILKPSFLESMAFLMKMKKEPVVAFDIEVSNEEVSCISFCGDPMEIISIPFTHDGDYFTIEQEGHIWKAIASVLEDPAQSHVGQNTTFDAWFLYTKLGIRVSNCEDTMIAQNIVNPDFPKGLHFITSIYTKEPYYKDEGKASGGFYGSTNMQFWKYNAKDSAVTLESYYPLMNDLKTMKNTSAYRRQVNIIPPLVAMSYHGVKVDVAGLREEARKDERQLEILQEELNKLVGHTLNPNSPKQLIQYFYVDKKHKPYLKQGRMTTDDTALKRLARKGVLEASVIQEMRKIRKLKGTYHEMEFDEDDRLRSAFNPAGTRTGRLSSGKTIFGTGGNMQNIPYSVRKYLLADEGYVAYEIDLSQAENRLVAYLANEPMMIDAFESGRDIHRQTAGLLFDKDPNLISDEPGSSVFGNGTKSERDWGKISNHSLNYDFGYKAYALKFEMSDAHGKYIVERYHAIYPNIRSRFHQWVRDSLSRNRTVTNIFGRSQRFLDRWGNELFKDAYAFPAQSTVADIINMRGLSYIWYNQDLFKPLILMNQVHDSIVFQIPLSVSWDHHVAMLTSIKRSLETPLEWRGTQFVIPADTKMGLNLGQMIDTDPMNPEEAYEKIRKLD